MINWIKNLFQNRTFGAVRSPKWRDVRKEHIKDNPLCSVCNTTKRLEVHHIIPVHVDKGRELIKDNLITLCNRDHFSFGHLYNYRSYNPTVKEDAELWNIKVQNRL